MRHGLVTSTALHAIVLGWGLISLSGPERLDAGVVETLPVDIVPISELTQIQQGESDAELAETASPEPTESEEVEPDAQNVGDNEVDLDTPPTPEVSDRAVEEAAAPETVDEPEPPTPEPEPQPEPEPVEEEPTETAALPEPSEAVEPEPEAVPLPESETPEAAAPEEAPEEAALPENVPVPTPRPPRPEPVEPEEVEEIEPEPERETAEQSSPMESEFDADEVAALLNQEQASGGGQRRTQDEAALGGRTTTTGETLSQSELDALRGQIQRCWNIIPGMAGAEDVRVRVTMRLNPNGEIDGQPQVSASGGPEGTQRSLSGGALRAVMRCAPYQLPAEKYETWSEVVVNFDPSQMF